MRNLKKIITGVSLFFIFSPMVIAKNFPFKPITIIVPYGAGGSNDNFVRALTRPLKKALGTNVIVRNISGGGGAVGTMIALAHEPDGYTVTITSNALYTLQALGNVKFKTADLDYIARVATEPYVLAVNTKDEWSSLTDFVQSASKKQITLGYAGVGSSTHVMAKAIANELGINAKLIPFGGGSAAVAATLGGHIDGVVLTPAGVVSGLESGKLTAIAATGKSSQLPNITLFTDQGYSIDTLQWRGIAAPAGLPIEVKAKWVAAITEAIQDDSFRKSVSNIGVDINPAFGESLESFVQEGSNKLISLTKVALVK